MHPFKIEIPKRSSHCYKGKESFQSGMEYYSLLLDDDSTQLIRQDYCTSCWKEVKTENSFGYWKSRIELKQEPKKITNKERIEKALSIITDSQSHQDENELFLLALFLARARQLILRKEFVENNQAYQLYEIAHEDEFITIKKMRLNQLKIDALQTSLSDKLCKMN